MKKLTVFGVLISLLTAYSCSITKNMNQDNLYNRHNEVKAKVKNGLFSSKTVSFGNYSTGKKEKGVDKHIINFRDQSNPFHFSLNDNNGNITSVQAVYTQKKDLSVNNLPDFFNGMADGASVYYSWIRGGSVNALQNWELILKNPTYEGLKQDAQTGVLQTANQIITVHANNRFGSPASYQNMCYEFQLQGVPVAAVQVNGKDKVWMEKQLDPSVKFVIAGAIASILMR